MDNVWILAGADTVQRPVPLWLDFENTRERDDELGCESNMRRYGSLCTCGAHAPAQG